MTPIVSQNSNSPRAFAMQYDIEADWTLLTGCNYRCDYCFISDEDLGQRLPRTGAVDDWVEAFSRTKRRWLLHITGGEPFLYPDFSRLCARLSTNHYLSLNSNLSRDSQVREFARIVAPSRVHYINAALHWNQRAKKRGLESFIASVLALRSAGHFVFISLVMDHETIRLFPEIRERLLGVGLYPAPKVARGNTRSGERYPEGYTLEEKVLISRYLRESRDHYAPHWEGMGEPPTINVLMDEQWLQGFPVYHGRLCDSGFRFVSVKGNGDVVRCGSRQPLGNLLEGTFKPLEGPKVCDTGYCTYYCEKFSRKERESEE